MIFKANSTALLIVGLRYTICSKQQLHLLPAASNLHLSFLLVVYKHKSGKTGMKAWF